MAIMINCATDWTYDLFAEDCKAYTGTPIKGVRRPNASDREQFIVWLKNAVRDFRAEWAQTCDHDYDNYRGWIGDAFARELDNMCFSDFYKDTYRQRPHLARWFYVHALGLPMNEDIARTFCAHPVEEAVESAKRVREVA